MSGQDELTDIFDDRGIRLGTVTREEAEANNHVTQNVVVFIFDDNGRVWKQKRPKTKKHYPGLWDVSACGGVLAGENPASAAQREQQEEMGYISDLKHVETFLNAFLDESGDTTRRRLTHIFIGVSNEIPILSDEVDEFVASPHEELIRAVINAPKEYMPPYLLELEKAVAAYKKLFA